MAEKQRERERGRKDKEGKIKTKACRGGRARGEGKRVGVSLPLLHFQG